MRMLRIAAILGLALSTALALGCGAFKRFGYEGPGRDEWQQPERVVDSLGLEPGDRVADIGSGSGYFTLRLAEAVGPEGRVYAADVDREMNEYLRERLQEEGVDNVEVVDAQFADPLLPDGSIDLVFSSNTFHHMEQRPDYFRDLQGDLAPDGRVAIVDFDGRKGFFVKLIGHFTEKDELLSDMKEAGYDVRDDFDFVDRQSFVVFAPATAPPD